MSRLRLGALSSLRMVEGRRSNPRLKIGERMCRPCKVAGVEAIDDEYHFLLDCKLFTDLRTELEEKVGYELKGSEDTAERMREWAREPERKYPEDENVRKLMLYGKQGGSKEEMEHLGEFVYRAAQRKRRWLRKHKQRVEM